MRLPIAVVVVAAASPLFFARAEAPPQPDPSMYAEPQADTSPTGFSCTAATLLGGDDCVFESEARPSADVKAQAAANLEAARRLATEGCRAAARVGAEPDADVLAACQQLSAKAVEGCGIGGKLPLLDAESRFAPAARPCYEAIAETLRRTRLMASVSAGCCRCSVANRCAKSGPQCNRDLTAGTPRLTACEASKCAEPCSAFSPSTADEDAFQPPVVPPAATRLKTL